MRHQLTARDRAVVEAYVACGCNAAMAYKHVSPHASAATCKSEAGRLLARPHVRRYLDARLDDHCRRLQITSAEVLGRIVQDARADLRELFDEHGHLLPPQTWPPTIANSIESYELRPDGGVRVRLVSKLGARRTLLDITGVRNSPAREEVSVLARAIRGDLAQARSERTRCTGRRRPADPVAPLIGAHSAALRLVGAVIVSCANRADDPTLHTLTVSCRLPSSDPQSAPKLIGDVTQPRHAYPQHKNWQAPMKLLLTVLVVSLANVAQAETITSPNQLSPYHVVIDFENVAGANPLVVGQATFTSLTGSLVIFNVSHWPANGTEIYSNTLFPGEEPDSAIAIDFAEPVSEILLGWGDPNFPGNVLRAFDASGNLLEEAEVELDLPGGGHAAWIGFRRQTADIKRVIVQPDQSLPSGDDYVIANIHIGPSPQALLSTLINDVISLNIRAGIANSFDAKLSAVMAAIDDTRQRNPASAVNGLTAFINAVRAQSGKELTSAQAESLISSAERIISLLGG